ncbi:MAG: hypothetical protein H6Q90_7072 [Deltaproteobacteria bacterium]|nr:hypothetical protein [Deltaproteobacteria bacterium]
MRGWLLLGAIVAATSLVFAEAAPAISQADAKRLLAPGTKTKCTTIVCLIEDAYAADPVAQGLALALFHDTGTIAGVGPAELMDGGYRGTIRLVPQLPLGKYRKHLTWTDGAIRSIDAFFGELFANQATAPNYRWRALSMRFVRSVKKRTPSAYAFGWTIEYNVEGSLLTSAPGVLETLFHELFHNNDFEHGDWSAKTLQTDYDAIVATCGTKARCLAPYAPNKTRVKATGTYYAFQPNNGNGVHEYAAELAVRYFTEQRQMLRDGKLAKPAFKCGPAENARAWQALITEFFAGRDLVPAC